MRLLLASRSATRSRLLRAAAVPFEIRASDVDEMPLRNRLEAAGVAAEEAALTLARAKAKQIARLEPEDTLVLGCDQILLFRGRFAGRPRDLEAARRQLRELRGARHELVSAAVLLRESQECWHTVEKARLWMRPFSEDFLDAYLTTLGERVTATVGGYELEGPGIQLFERIEGDFFAILGLPLLSLLEALRAQGYLPR